MLTPRSRLQRGVDFQILILYLREYKAKLKYTLTLV